MIDEFLRHSIESEYIAFNEYVDAYSSLKKLVVFLDIVETYPFDWKWAILALHNTLQGFLICDLRGASILEDIGVLYNSKKAESILEIESIDVYTKCTKLSSLNLKLISFNDLYEKVQKKYREMGKTLATCDYIQLLNDDLRNPFVHFFPKGWSIEKNMLYKVFQSCICFLESLLSESRLLCKYTDTQQKEIFNYIELIKNILQK